LMLIDSCITQLKAQGPARTCNKSKEEAEGDDDATKRMFEKVLLLLFITLKPRVE